MAVEWVRLQLDLEAFEDARFEPYLHRCRQSGIDFTTMADLGDTAECRRSLYELNKTCSADIPEQGEFYTFEKYLSDRIQIPTYHPRGVVLPGHRGQGISLAMKLLAIGFARSFDMRWLRTVHHPHNATAIAMNRRLGFSQIFARRETVGRALPWSAPS